MADPYRVTIYDNQVDAMWSPAGGEVYGWLRRLGQEHLAVARRTTPRRSGNLAGEFYPVPIMTPVGKRNWRYTIRNDADYAAYVHDGTSGPIYPHGTHLWIRPAPHSRYQRGARRLSVKGQSANPWITEAGAFVLGPYLGG